MLPQHSRAAERARVVHDRAIRAGVECLESRKDNMVLTFMLAWLSRPVRYRWVPALDLSDRRIYASLIPGTQY